MPDKLFPLYNKYKDNYKAIFMNMAIDVLTNNVKYIKLCNNF